MQNIRGIGRFRLRRPTFLRRIADCESCTKLFCDAKHRGIKSNILNDAENRRLMRLPGQRGKRELRLRYSRGVMPMNLWKVREK